MKSDEKISDSASAATTNDLQLVEGDVPRARVGDVPVANSARALGQPLLTSCSLSSF